MATDEMTSERRKMTADEAMIERQRLIARGLIVPRSMRPKLTADGDRTRMPCLALDRSGHQAAARRIDRERSEAVDAKEVCDEPSA
jgi:hypothetical protein